jgi:hypothetical protein
MRARADRLGATFHCESQVGKGTTIEVVVPAAAIAEMQRDETEAAPVAAVAESIRDG